MSCNLNLVDFLLMIRLMLNNFGECTSNHTGRHIVSVHPWSCSVWSLRQLGCARFSLGKASFFFGINKQPMGDILVLCEYPFSRSHFSILWCSLTQSVMTLVAAKWWLSLSFLLYVLAGILLQRRTFLPWNIFFKY